MAQEAPQQAQRYELVSTLGRGGMAEVFLGWMHSVGGLRRKVAIKRILPDLAQKQSQLFEQMFVDEARLAFQLEHDNIVRVYDVGQSANTFFIVMEYVEGMDVKRVYEKLVERQRPMPLDVALYLMTQVCSGLAYAHGITDDEGNHLGLIHNDISPPNILIGRYGEVKVADFGLSDAVSNAVATPEGMIKGKFAYISPEGTRDPTSITHKSDIFSVGIVLWELLAGQRLFQRNTDVETFRAVQSALIPDLRRIRGDVPEDLVEIIHLALAPDPDRRYDSMERLYGDLLGFSATHGIPLNRYALCHLINDLADHKWTGFSGERVSEGMIADLQNEIEGMLPPGVAAHLKTFVTGVSVADDVEDASGVQEDWVADVFGEVGFGDDEDNLTFGEDDSEDIPVTHNSGPSSPTLSENSQPSAPPRASGPSLPSAPRFTPTPGPGPGPAMGGSGRSPLPTPPPDQPGMVTVAKADLEAEIRSRGLNYLIWGATAGLTIGTAIGLLISYLL